jgi:hypothetical protein
MFQVTFWSRTLIMSRAFYESLSSWIFIPGKWFGVESLQLCISSNGYIKNLVIYVGKRADFAAVVHEIKLKTLGR